MCAVAVAALLGCDDGAEDASSVSEATTCSVVQNGGPWWNQPFAEQTGRFHVDFAATPSARNIDTVIGLSNGPATKWTSLAAIVRFNPQGYIDARSGDSYRADGSWPYVAGTTYYFRIEVDMAIKGYTVWVRTDPTAAWNALARTYAFRSEQLGVSRLTNIASFTNPETSGPGGIELCGVTVTRDASPTADCMVNTAGARFKSTPVTLSENVLMVAFRARATQDNMDGVFGVASGDVDAYDDFAASLRFWTNGKLEVRDGDTYRADREVTYSANQEFDVRMFIDLPSHTYSVYVNRSGLTPSDGHVLLASGYKFRPAQARVLGLDRFATVVASSMGGIEACQIAGGPHRPVVSMRDGTWQVKPLPNGSTLISKYNRTEVLGSNNVPLNAGLPFGGLVTVDAAGNLYVAQPESGARWVTVTSYEPDWFTRRWSYDYSTNAMAQDIIATTNGEIVVHVYGTQGGYLMRLRADGSVIGYDNVPGPTGNVALGPSEYMVARTEFPGYVFEAYAYGAPTQPLRSRRISGSYVVKQLALARDGSFAIAGDLYGPTDFGRGVLAPQTNPDTGNEERAFVVALAPNMSTRFGHTTGYAVRGLSVTGRWVAAANETYKQASYIDVVVYELGGTVVRSSMEDAFVGSYGVPGAVAIADTGLVYLNASASLADSYETYHPFLFSLGLW